MTLGLPVLAALSLILACPSVVQAESVRPSWIEAVRAERWPDADALAALQPDPLVRKLASYYRLLSPGLAHAAELATFLADNPDWPGQAQLARRLADAVAADRSAASVRALCGSRSAAALPPCPEAVLAVSLPALPEEAARAAWVRGIEPAAEAAFLQQWGRVLTTEDHQRRFDRLAWTDSGAATGLAARQAARLPPALRAAAEQRLALRRDDPAAVTPLGASSEPALVLDFARWHRRAGRDAEAAKVWTLLGGPAEAAAPPERRAAFWDERNLLARRLLRSGDVAAAYGVASTHKQAGEAALDAEFLAGWIALRGLGRPTDAARHFQNLAAQSRAAITQGRAHYWLARTAVAQGDDAAAATAYAVAATWPTTYYGQLATRALGDDNSALAARIAALQDPPFAPAEAQAILGGELARAAVLLAAWGEPRRAKVFLHQLGETASAQGARSAVAQLALSLGLPEQAVVLARRAGRDGVVLASSGWPQPVSPPKGSIERAVALGLMRQESSFDPQASSPVGARGLMQLMPATAAAVARRLNEPADVGALTRDPAYNMRLGTAYLQSLLDQFGGALPLALAAYNTGPSRVTQWLAANNDPRLGGVDMTDWIELIPFTETRNYVQRVLESVEIYRARQGGAGTQLAGTPE